MGLQDRLSFYGAHVINVELASSEFHDIDDDDIFADEFLSAHGFYPASTFPLHRLAVPLPGNLVVACYDSTSGWGMNGIPCFFNHRTDGTLIDEGRQDGYSTVNGGRIQIRCIGYDDRRWKILCQPDMSKIPYGKELLR